MNDRDSSILTKPRYRLASPGAPSATIANMTNDDVAKAYGSQSVHVEQLLGTEVAAADPDRNIIEPWAATVKGSILDVGSGTGRWTGHLATRGHDIEGLEPVEQLVDLARKNYPWIMFHRGSVNELADTDHRWAGLLAWYSVIHMGPEELPEALSVLRGVLQDDGTLLMSFFSGTTFMPFNHPVATAYLWPMDDMTLALETAGLSVVDQHWEPNAPHAHIIATATKH